MIQGPPTTLFRFKPRNPFSWGFTEILADGIAFLRFSLPIGGGLGTAIAEVPTVPYLLLSTEYPAGAYTLRSSTNADDTGFIQYASQDFQLLFYHRLTFLSSLLPVNIFLSVARRCGRRRLFCGDGTQRIICIVETDGIGINIVSEKISKTLRRMTTRSVRGNYSHMAHMTHATE